MEHTCAPVGASVFPACACADLPSSIGSNYTMCAGVVGPHGSHGLHGPHGPGNSLHGLYG